MASCRVGPHNGPTTRPRRLIRDRTGHPSPAPTTDVVLALACADRPGLVAAVSGFVFERGGNITESQQYGDTLTGDFFMRVDFADEGVGLEQLREDFAQVAERHAMTWQMHDARRPLRTLVMVSRFGHCLNDLLFRQSTGSLQVEIPAIVSNHRDLEGWPRATASPSTTCR
ncbi:ACT domain-containing protein [Janibacter melonis]|uniref:ACT domain-containing protein n=1 Tax=Janibacter melonis TaxID=262209 RepID=UPI0035582F0F